MTGWNRGEPDAPSATGISRRAFLQTSAVAGVAAAAGVPLVSVARAQTRTLKIGYMGAQSGMRANFGETTPWAIERVRRS